MPKASARCNAQDEDGVHDRSGGPTAKGWPAHRRANPGSKLKTAVTTPPLLKKGYTKVGSFCLQSGMGPDEEANDKLT